MTTQMLRVEAYSAIKARGVIGEANRELEFSAHIACPSKPLWILGSAAEVKSAQAAHMKTPAAYNHKNGKQRYRKRRVNHRCLVAGFASWPTPISKLRELPDEEHSLKKWCRKLQTWLENQFGENLKGLIAHNDEGYFHVHFLVVGDANLIHPGLKEEFLDGHRIPSGRTRHNNHVAGLRAFLDSYQQSVGAEFGLTRKSEAPKGPRIPNRALANRLLELEKKVEMIGDAELKNELEKLYSDATFSPYP